jgi:hypothetical protein
VAVENEVSYRHRYVCDICAAEEIYASSWGEIGSDVHYPKGWVRFYAMSVMQSDDVLRAGRDIDICPVCLKQGSLRAIIEKIPYDSRSLKGTINA